MKFVGNYKKIAALLAIIGVFSTVVPAHVWAEDMEFITNIVFSSEKTGGVSLQGKDGKNGQDGKPGHDGQDGSNGESVSNGESSASVHVGSTVNGKRVVDIQTTQTVPANDSSIPAIHTTSSSQVQAIGSLNSSDDRATSPSAFLALRQALFSLQSMIVNYVSTLF